MLTGILSSSVRNARTTTSSSPPGDAEKDNEHIPNIRAGRQQAVIAMPSRGPPATTTTRPFTYPFLHARTTSSNRRRGERTDIQTTPFAVCLAPHIHSEYYLCTTPCRTLLRAWDYLLPTAKAAFLPTGHLHGRTRGDKTWALWAGGHFRTPTAVQPGICNGLGSTTRTGSPCTFNTTPLLHCLLFFSPSPGDGTGFRAQLSTPGRTMDRASSAGCRQPYPASRGALRTTALPSTRITPATPPSPALPTLYYLTRARAALANASRPWHRQKVGRWATWTFILPTAYLGAHSFQHTARQLAGRHTRAKTHLRCRTSAALPCHLYQPSPPGRVKRHAFCARADTGTASFAQWRQTGDAHFCRWHDSSLRPLPLRALARTAHTRVARLPTAGAALL